MTTKETIFAGLRKQKEAVSDIDFQARKREWVESLSRLIDILCEWTREAEDEDLLSSDRYLVEINEEHLGAYSAPALRLTAPSGGTIDIRPRALFITGARGRVDWEGAAGRTAMLIRTNSNEWEFAKIETTGRWFFTPLSEESFWEVVGHLLD